MKIICMLLVIIMYVGCTRHLEKRQVGSQVIEAYFIDDSIANGPVKYFNKNGTIESEGFIKKGKKHGAFTSFFSNGRIHETISFVNGLPNGSHNVYDPEGKLETKSFFLRGIKIGEQFDYSNGLLTKYQFTDSTNKLLYSCTYDSGKISGFKIQNIINFNVQQKIEGDSNKSLVSLYWLNPPLVDIKYYLGIANKVSEKERIITELTKTGILKDTLLPNLSADLTYFIQADYYIPQSKFHQIYISWFPD